MVSFAVVVAFSAVLLQVILTVGAVPGKQLIGNLYSDIKLDIDTWCLHCSVITYCTSGNSSL